MLFLAWKLKIWSFLLTNIFPKLNSILWIRTINLWLLLVKLLLKRWSSIIISPILSRKGNSFHLRSWKFQNRRCPKEKLAEKKQLIGLTMLLLLISRRYKMLNPFLSTLQNLNMKKNQDNASKFINLSTDSWENRIFLHLTNQLLKNNGDISMQALF